MDICSPKDGFIVKTLVADHSAVNVGTPLFTMDTDDEGRTRTRLNRLDEVRAQLTAQYQGEEQETARQIAQLAVSMAQDLVDLANYQLRVVIDQVKTNEAYMRDQKAAESKLSQAKMALQKSQLDLKNFEFAIKRHLSVSTTIKDLLANEIEANALKQGRLTIVSPVQGKVTFHMATNSFAKLGRPVVTVA